MKTRAIFIVAFCCLAVSPASASEYKLVWSDEFEGGEVDRSAWGFDVYPGVISTAKEVGQYTDRRENVRIDDGHLVVTARKEAYEYSSFTSARLNTFGKKSFRYGRIEMRAKLPCGDGLRSKLWLLPDELTYGSWGASGELVILEAFGSQLQLQTGIHFGGSGPRTEHDVALVDRDSVKELCTEFHTFAVEWQPFEMRWFIDDQLVARRNRWSSAAAAGYPAPFDKSFYLNLALAVDNGIDPATLQTPKELRVDWIRVYQAEGNDAPRVRLTNPHNGAKSPTGSTIELRAEASDADGNLAAVEFYANGQLIGQVAKAPFTFSWPAEDGCYRIIARAVDSVGYAHADSIEIEQGIGCPPRPYHGKPSTIPGIVEAEDFDESPKGEAYFDADPGNNGNHYRTDTGVDIQPCSEGGSNVCWMVNDEWMQYTVHVEKEGQYDVRCRAASPNSDARIHVEFDGVDVTGSLTIPNTGDWQRYTDVVRPRVLLEEGTHVMRVFVDHHGLNLNYIAFTPSQ